MAKLEVSPSGELVLDLSTDDDWTIRALKDVLFYFDYSEGLLPGSFTIGQADRLLEILPFLIESSKKKGINVAVDEHVERLFESFKEQKEAIATALSSRMSRGKTNLPRLPTRKLLDHQVVAAQKLVRLSHCADFSVPGSGKTTVALALFEYRKKIGEVEKLMVIGPASCFAPWQDEWEACLGREPESLRFTGEQRKRELLVSKLSDKELLLCTYQMAYREVELLTEVLQAYSWMLVLDESHNVKRYEGGAWAEAVLRLSPHARRRIILTGTPAPRSLEDVWTQFTFLWPSQELLGSRLKFETMVTDEGIDGVASRLRPFFHRTKKQDLGLPEPIVVPTIIESRDWPIRQRKIVRILETKTLRELKTLNFSRSDFETIRRWRRSRIIRLLQAASNPALLSGRSVELGESGPSMTTDPDLEDLVRNYSKLERSAKITFAENKTRELVSNGRKVVIWTWFIGNINLLAKLLEDLNPLTAYGEIKAFEEDEDTLEDESRERNIRSFRTDPRRPILIANPSACSESISLHKECHDAIYVERTFNCAQFLQSMDRIHRVGMPKGETASYYLPILDCAIDRLVDTRLHERQAMLLRILSDESIPIGGLGESELFDNEYDLEAVFEDLRHLLQNKR